MDSFIGVINDYVVDDILIVKMMIHSCYCVLMYVLILHHHLLLV
jgi:hypothetical protein